MKYSAILLVFMRYFRKKRLRWFREWFPPEACRTIVDVGGTPQIWDMLRYPSAISLVNSDTHEVAPSNGYATAVADGRMLPFQNRAFDLAFSNSVIEHVGGWADMERFASELRRVGSSYFCQTPNKWFPIEPHLGTIFLHWFPWLLNQYLVVRYLTLWGLINKPSRAATANSLSGIHLLTRSQIERLFPDAHIVTERFLLLPKSYTAVRS